MTITYRKRRGVWEYDFWVNNVRHTGTASDADTGEPSKTKTTAKAAEAVLKAKAKKGEPLTTRASSPAGYTISQMFAYYAMHVGTQRRSWDDTIKPAIKELRSRFGDDTPVEDVRKAEVRAYIAWCRKQKVRHYVGGRHAGGEVVTGDRFRSGSTINKNLNVLRAALNLALSDEKIARAPDVPREGTPDDNPNPVQQADLQHILALAPQHLRDVLTLCTSTGMRQQECVQLSWRQTDLTAGHLTLYSADTKANKGRTVYLNKIALAVLMRLDAERPEPRTLDQRIILYRHKGTGRPRPIDSIDTAWRSTLKLAGLKEDGSKGKYRFHDTRAAFCSYLAELGVDPSHIKQLAGHASITTTMKYVKASDARLRAAVDALGEKMATPAGLEPATSDLEGQSSIQLSYGVKNGTSEKVT